MRWTTPRCDVAAWGEWHTIVRAKKKPRELWLLGICSVTTKGTGIRIILPTRGSLRSNVQREGRWGHWDSFHVLRKDGIIAPNLSCIWSNVPLQSCILAPKHFPCQSPSRFLKSNSTPSPSEILQLPRPPFLPPAIPPVFQSSRFIVILLPASWTLWIGLLYGWVIISSN